MLYLHCYSKSPRVCGILQGQCSTRVYTEASRAGNMPWKAPAELPAAAEPASGIGPAQMAKGAGICSAPHMCTGHEAAGHGKAAAPARKSVELVREVQEHACGASPVERQPLLRVHSNSLLRAGLPLSCTRDDAEPAAARDRRGQRGSDLRSHRRLEYCRYGKAPSVRTGQQIGT